jgi:hypothetical protein
MSYPKILKNYLDYKQIEKEVDNIYENLNKHGFQKAKKLYLEFKEKIKKFIERVAFLIEEIFFKENMKLLENKKEKVHDFIHRLVSEISLDKDNYLFSKKVTEHSQGNEKTTFYEGKIITLSKILKTKDENFWFLLDDILPSIDTILDIIDDKEFLSKYNLVSKERKQTQDSLKILKNSFTN